MEWHERRVFELVMMRTSRRTFRLECERLYYPKPGRLRWFIRYKNRVTL